MLKVKKIWLILLGIMLPICINFLYNPCLWKLSDWKPIIPEMEKDSTPTIDKKEPMREISQWSYGISRKFKWILRLDEPENYDTSLWYVLALIQITINRFLWILAVVALVYMLYCGFLIFSSWANDTTKGKKWVKNTAIALAWIGLAWLIVSAIIRFIETMADKWTNI